MCFLEGGREALRNDWEEKSSGGAGEGREEHGGEGHRERRDVRREGATGEVQVAEEEARGQFGRLDQPIAYLQRLAQLQIEGDHAHALQPGREARPGYRRGPRCTAGGRGSGHA